jgi:hypothetical protein
MVLQQCRFLIPKRLSNILAFFLGKNDAVELLVDDVVLYPSANIHNVCRQAYIVERARILGNDIQRSAQRAERSAMKTMAVRRTNNIRSSSVDCGMNHVCRGVEQADLASIDDLPFMIHANQIRRLDLRECYAEWIDPKGVRFDGVAQRDMAGHTYHCQ